MSWLDDTWGTLFGSSSPGAVGSSVYGPPSSAAPSTTLGGLLDPRGIRQQAFFQGLGSLSQGLLAAGLPHPATQGSMIPGALGAFQPAYNAGIQSGGQMAALEQQARQQNAWQGLLASTPAGPLRQAYEAAGPSVATAIVQRQLQQVHLASPEEHQRAGVPYGTLQIDANGQYHLLQTPTIAGLTANLSRDPIVSTPAGPFARDALLPGGGAPAGGAPAGGAPAPAAPGGAAPAATPPAAESAPLGLRANNPLNLGGEDAIRTGSWSYATPEEGTAAAVRQIVLNASRSPTGTLTPTQLVQTWIRPTAGESPQAYQQRVDGYAGRIASGTGTRPDQALNLSDPAVLARVVTTMATVEQGILPQGYDQIIARGVQAAAQPGPIRPGSTRPYAGYGGGAAAPAPGTAPAPATAPPQVAQAGGAPAPAPAPAPVTAPAPATAAPAAVPAAPAAPDVPALLPNRAGVAPPVTLPTPDAGAQLVLRRQPGQLLAGPSNDQITQARELRGQFLGNTEIKNSLRVANVLTAMETARHGTSAASDLNLVYGLMTILDPGSVVREGESVMVQQTQSVPQHLQGLINRVLQGGAALGEEGRQAIMQEARTRVEAQINSYNHLRGGEETLIRAANLNPEVVLGPRLSMPPQMRAPEPPQQPPPPASTAVTPTAPPDAPAPAQGGPRPQPPPAPPPPPPGTAAIPPRPPAASPLTPAQIGMASTATLTDLVNSWDQLTPAQRDAVTDTVRARERSARPPGSTR